MRESFRQKQEATESLHCLEELRERLQEESRAREQLAEELNKAESKSPACDHWDRQCFSSEIEMAMLSQLAKPSVMESDHWKIEFVLRAPLGNLKKPRKHVHTVPHSKDFRTLEIALEI